MIVGIYTNIFKDGDLTITKKLVNQLIENKIEFFVYENLADKICGAIFNESSRIVFDLIITIGGDGTILRIAKWCALKNIPILGINLGKVGFLTEIELNGLGDVINVIKKQGFKTEKRALLKTQLGGKPWFALNEFVISRQNMNKMIMLDVFVNGQMLDSYYCDGYIVSTPTGSTAYSLSAGGPVISPKTKALALTPINSHSLHSRPIVISEDESVELRLPIGGSEASVLADGELIHCLKGGDGIKIVKAAECASFVRIVENNFFGRLLEKLNKWSVTLEVNG